MGSLLSTGAPEPRYEQLVEEEREVDPAPELPPSGEPWTGQLPQDLLEYIVLLSAWDPSIGQRDTRSSWSQLSRCALACKATRDFVNGRDRPHETPGVPRVLSLSLQLLPGRTGMLRAIVTRLGVLCTEAEARVPWDLRTRDDTLHLPLLHQLRLSAMASRPSREVSDAALGLCVHATGRPLTNLEAHKNALHRCFGDEVNGHVEAAACLDIRRPESLDYWNSCSQDQREAYWRRARTYFFDMRHTHWDVGSGTVAVVTTALPSGYSGPCPPQKLDPPRKNEEDDDSEPAQGPLAPGSTTRCLAMHDWQKLAARIYLFLRRPELIALPRFMTALLVLLADWERACERGEAESLGELGYASSGYANVAVYAIWRTKLLLGQGIHAVCPGQQLAAEEQQRRLLLWIAGRARTAADSQGHSPFQPDDAPYWRDRTSCMAMSRFWFSKTGIRKASSSMVEEIYSFPDNRPIDFGYI